jgi:hypothetical protein
MKSTFAKTYYTDKLNISVRIDRESFCWSGCRLTIKDRINRRYVGFGRSGEVDRIVYTWFPNDKHLFKCYREEMKKVKIPNKDIKEIIDDMKSSLMYEKVVVYKPISSKMSWL